MVKVDSHQHFWQLGRLAYPWLSPDMTALYRNFTPADLAPELAACNIDTTIVVQAAHSLEETRWLLSLARETPFVSGVVGWVDLTAPDLEDQLAALAEQGPLCGVRHQVHDEPDERWLLQPRVVDGLRTLARRGMPYDLLVRPAHCAILPELFALVPDMVWIIDHIAKPKIAAGEMQPWLEYMQRVAQHPQVYCKVSGMITEADHAGWTVADIRPYFEQVLHMVGPRRLMYGSDWPVCLLAGSYRQVHDLVAQLIEQLSPSEQAAIWGDTAAQVYGIRPDATR